MGDFSPALARVAMFVDEEGCSLQKSVHRRSVPRGQHHGVIPLPDSVDEHHVLPVEPLDPRTHLYHTLADQPDRAHIAEGNLPPPLYLAKWSLRSFVQAYPLKVLRKPAARPGRLGRTPGAQATSRAGWR